MQSMNSQKAAPSKAQPSLLRQLNQRRVLAVIQAHGPLSRAEITRHTGISGPTVTRAVEGLLGSRLLEEEEPQQTAVGRPGKLVRLARKHVSVLGVVVGAQRSEVVAAGLDGEILPGKVRPFATPASYRDLVGAIAHEARELVAERSASVLGVGISVPGLLNRREGRSLFSPNVHQLDGHNLRRDVAETLGWSTAVVQECHGLCLAEQLYGEARGVDDFAMLDISEGLGLGAMHGGRILQGHSGLAGELGHITAKIDGLKCGCGNRGCLETVATDAALARAVGRRLGRSLSIDEVLALSERGEIDIQEEMADALEYLAVGVAAVINIFNPHKLFIYGRLLDAAPTLFETLLSLVGKRALAPNLADCQIIRARGSKRLGAVAAAIGGATTDWESS